jgi:hypothetical protein
MMIIQQLWIRILIWLIIEILLNLLGLDELADYSEFIFKCDSNSFPHKQYS